MRDYTNLLKNSEKSKHPTTSAIGIEEVPALIDDLKTLTEMTNSELDLSPASLKRLEKRLVEFQRSGRLEMLSDDNTLMLIRSLAAYIGEVLVVHCQGTWNPFTSLWSTFIVFEGVSVKKNRIVSYPSKIRYSLGNLAAITLDKIVRGNDPHLYSYYQNAAKKRFEEK